MQPREREVGGATPRRRQGGGEVILLGEQVDRPVAAAARLDEDDLGGLRQDIGDQRRLGAVVEPRQPALHALEEGALGEALPLLAAPWLEGDEPAGPLAQGLARQHLTGREDHRLGDVVDGALVVDAERRQSVDLVAPQVDAHRGVTGRREHVEIAPRRANSRGARPAPRGGSRSRRGDGRTRRDRRWRRGARDRLGGQGAGTEPLQKGPDAGDDHPRAALRVAKPPQHLEARPIVSTDGLSRSNGSVSQAGKTATSSAVDELGEVVGELAGHRPGRRGDEERAVVR